MTWLRVRRLLASRLRERAGSNTTAPRLATSGRQRFREAVPPPVVPDYLGCVCERLRLSQTQPGVHHTPRPAPGTPTPWSPPGFPPAGRPRATPRTRRSPGRATRWRVSPPQLRPSECVSPASVIARRNACSNFQASAARSDRPGSRGARPSLTRCSVPPSPAAIRNALTRPNPSRWTTVPDASMSQSEIARLPTRSGGAGAVRLREGGVRGRHRLRRGDEVLAGVFGAGADAGRVHAPDTTGTTPERESRAIRTAQVRWSSPRPCGSAVRLLFRDPTLRQVLVDFAGEVGVR